MENSNETRLQKYLANAGIASRRKCEEYILAGKVTVNGKLTTELGTKIDPNKDIVEFNGQKIGVDENKKYTYILLNKPVDYVTTAKDQFGRKTVLDIIGDLGMRLVPVRKTRHVHLRSINPNR